MTDDIRWQQRFSNYVKALDKLRQSVDYVKANLEAGDKEDNEKVEKVDEILEEIVKEGLIQRFEYTHELAWNVMKDYATFQGNSNVGGSRDATREALQLLLISDGNVWMDMIQSKNKTSHTYNEETANEIYGKILNEYFPVFLNFKVKMEEKRSGEQKNIFE